MEFLSSWNWGSIADWVSGLGSLAAVITALYLAEKGQRIELKGYCGIRRLTNRNLQESGPDLLSISVTNSSIRIARVNVIGMRINKLEKVGRFKFRRPQAIIHCLFDQTQLSPGLPKSIEDGETVLWSIPLDDDKEWIKDLFGNFVKSESDAKSLRFLICTTHGAPKVLRPEAELVREITDAIQAKVI